MEGVCEGRNKKRICCEINPWTLLKIFDGDGVREVEDLQDKKSPRTREFRIKRIIGEINHFDDFLGFVERWKGMVQE